MDEIVKPGEAATSGSGPATGALILAPSRGFFGRVLCSRLSVMQPPRGMPQNADSASHVGTPVHLIADGRISLAGIGWGHLKLEGNEQGRQSGCAKGSQPTGVARHRPTLVGRRSFRPGAVGHDIATCTLPWSSCHLILDAARLQGSELAILTTSLELSVPQRQRLPFDLIRKCFAGSTKTQHPP